MANPKRNAIELPELALVQHQARTALDLAIVALAPSRLIYQLATAVGLLESLGDLPAESAPVVALIPTAVARAKSSLDDWQVWHKEHRGTRISSG
jgi:hypothetical protein